ncbi:MAG TPA: 2-dehydro-3-deoxy-D-gluconate 5-dehydrogenase KduD [Terriglobales bacterium]|nr:2-dehydro-3-deoxy-D-gluconate 5-dehydrogenase KduD [Terriglobales bacterium]
MSKHQLESAIILDSFKLTAKTALVTGSQTGLGAGIAIALAQAGANIVLHGRDNRGANEVRSAIEAAGSTSEQFSGDISEPKVCEELVSFTVEKFGSLDILVNNAGIIRRAPASEFSEEDWYDVIEVNLNAVFRLCQIAGRHMLQQGHGKIINIASLLAFQGGVFVPSYAAAKGAVAQLTKALANEWAPRGINVNAIAPGYMATDNTAPLRADPIRNQQIVDRIPTGRWGTPEDLGGAAVFLASSASDYVNGHVLVVDGGWLAR